MPGTRLAAVVCGLACTCISGCGSDPTQVIVALNSDLMVPAELGQIRVILVDKPSDPPSSALEERVFGLKPGDLPLSFGVHQTDDTKTDLTLIFQALGSGGPPPLFESRANVSFVEGKTVRISVFLSRNCLSIPPCAMPLTCRNGACGPDHYEGNDVQEVEPGEELVGIMWPPPIPPDAGMMMRDGGPPPPMDGGPPPDAAPPMDSGLPQDAGPPSDGGLDAGGPTDTGTTADAGFADAGVDAGFVDSGVCVPADAGSPMPASCNVDNDCLLPGACPCDAMQGCACVLEMMVGPGKVCIPRCNNTSDCPTSSPMPLMCDPNSMLCVPQM